MSKTQKTNKQFEKEQTKGKLSYQKRVLAEEEADLLVREFVGKPSCLDAAYERKALEQGFDFEPVFPENKCDKEKN